MNSWQDLFVNYRPQAPANDDVHPFWTRFNNGPLVSQRAPLSPQDYLQTSELPGVQSGGRPNLPLPANSNLNLPRGNPSAPPLMTPAKTPMPPLANQNRTPYQKLLNPDPNIEDIIAQQAFNIAKRLLPPWVQAGLAGAGAVLTPTPTAPPEMDEAPPWSWPSAGSTPGTTGY
jgi:hypothetical protein